MYMSSHTATCKFSRKVLWMKLTPTNKDPHVVVKCFLDTVAKCGGYYVRYYCLLNMCSPTIIITTHFHDCVIWLQPTYHLHTVYINGIYYAEHTFSVGCPNIVRGDKGTENTLIARSQLAFRLNHDDSLANMSFMYGKSVANTVRKIK